MLLGLGGQGVCGLSPRLTIVHIHLTSYQVARYYETKMWTVESTDEYQEWFSHQDGEAKEAILGVVLLLREFGPLLSRPHADTLKGSTYKNLKELRAKTASQILRVAFLFDEQRKALLLIGGNKRGANEKDFYKKLIADAEELVKRYRG